MVLENRYRTTPYARLWNMFSTSVSSSANTVNNANLMAQHYVRVHGEAAVQFFFGNNSKATTNGPTFATRMRTAGVRWVTNYRNGSYVSQGMPTEAPSLEENFPRAIQVFWPGDSRQGGTAFNAASRLRQDIGTNATTIRIASARAAAPTVLTQAQRNIWPFRSSRGASLPTVISTTTSIDTNNFVSWIRIDNELIGIPKGSSVTYESTSDTVVITGAIRGMWGTARASHTANTRVMAPVYIGSVTQGADRALAGSPAVGDDGTQNALRYAIRFGTSGGAQFIGDRIEATFLKNDADNPWQGYNGIHYDVSSSFFYNVACAYGTNIVPWNLDTNAKYNATTWANAQVFKFQNHADRTGWGSMQLFGNNLFRDPGDIPILNTLDNLREDCGGTHEGFGKSNAGGIATGSEWLSTHANRALKAMSNDQTLSYWVRWDRDFSGNADQLMRISYCTMLLALKYGSVKYMYGTRWNMSAPNPMFFWELGRPVESATTNITELQESNGLYVREFDNAYVVVNPTGSGINFFVPGSGGYVVQNNTTPALLGPIVFNVSIPGADARIIMKTAGATTNTYRKSFSIASLKKKVITKVAGVDANLEQGGSVVKRSKTHAVDANINDEASSFTYIKSHAITANLRVIRTDPVTTGTKKIFLPKKALVTVDGTTLTDHQRSSASISYEPIKNDERTMTGTLKRQITGYKKSLSISWDMLPALDSQTVDGYAGRNTIKSLVDTAWSNNTSGLTVSWFEVDSNNQQVETVMIARLDSYQESLLKRFDKQYWSAEISFIEI